MVRETVMVDALTRFFTERVFGPDRAAMLTAHIPASAAAAEQRRHTKAETIRRKLAKIDTAENALITELETPADPSDPAAQALRQRIRARFTELYGQRTTLEAELAALDAAAPATQADDPTLLDELPHLGDILTGAPPALTEQLLDAFDIQATYNRDKHQATIHGRVAPVHCCTGAPSGPRMRVPAHTAQASRCGRLRSSAAPRCSPPTG